MKKLKIFSAVLIACLLIPLLFSATVFAEENKEAGDRYDLNLDYKYENAPFYALKVADGNASDGFTVKEAFQTAGILPEQLEDQDEWLDLAEELNVFVLQNKVKADRSGKTDENGFLSFSEMEEGLYLIRGDKIEIGSFAYTPTPFMIALPCIDAISGEILTEVTAEPKANEEKIKKTITRRLIAIWNDKGNDSHRPEEITVILYQDDEEYSVVTLSSENEWKYVWEKLPTGHVWSIKAPDVEYYTYTTDKKGDTFRITYVPKTSTNGGGGSGTNLPATGQLWWPVPILLACGLLCVVIGLLLGRKRRS